MPSRRSFLEAAAAGALIPASIARALAIPADHRSGTIQDVRHIVILMQENRSFDHYFGTLRGVRGFGDRHPVPMAGGKPVWRQSDGTREIPPYHLDTATTSAMRMPDMPHNFPDAQAAWNQGKFGFWPKFKTQFSMGHYRRTDLPFQFALAEAFTICDAHHCSVTSGTDPNRIMFFSGSNFDPHLRALGVNSTDADSEPSNVRCLVEGALPDPGYTYHGAPLSWETIPDVLERAGISWRIYQDPNDNYAGLMHGGLAFESFRNAKSGTPLYEKGMRNKSIEQLAADVKNGTLPQVSWVLPSAKTSEHPGPSSPAQGAEFTASVLDAITANPQTWSRTAFFLTFDENDGLFDHVPPPAPPSLNADGSMAGKSTLDLAGHYFADPQRKHLHPEDTISGTLRPWGLGARVPLYVISPWSRGGWVNSETFCHTSVGQFLERRFGITIPAISPWHRAVCGDLTSAFNFASPNETARPDLPATVGADALVAAQSLRPSPLPPATPQQLFQEPGTRPSRALPYVLHVDAGIDGGDMVLTFRNDGTRGAVFHVYDRGDLEAIPRRHTVEAGKSLTDSVTNPNLWIIGPGGFLRELRGHGTLEAQLRYDVPRRKVRLEIRNSSDATQSLAVLENAYKQATARQISVPPHGTKVLHLSTIANWYDVSVTAEGFQRRFAGRMETGRDGVSDPALAI